MSVIITDSGFHGEDWPHGFVDPEALGRLPCALQLGVDLKADDTPERLVPHFPRIGLIRIRFAHFTDGRGFSLAQRLRTLGYRGRLRALGHVLADQYTMARRSGFDEVEISAELALRQPPEHWRFYGNWRHHDYLSRMRA